MLLFFFELIVPFYVVRSVLPPNFDNYNDPKVFQIVLEKIRIEHKLFRQIDERNQERLFGSEQNPCYFFLL